MLKPIQVQFSWIAKRNDPIFGISGLHFFLKSAWSAIKKKCNQSVSWFCRWIRFFSLARYHLRGSLANGDFRFFFIGRSESARSMPALPFWSGKSIPVRQSNQTNVFRKTCCAEARAHQSSTGERKRNSALPCELTGGWKRAAIMMNY